MEVQFYVIYNMIDNTYYGLIFAYKTRSGDILLTCTHT